LIQQAAARFPAPPEAQALLAYKGVKSLFELLGKDGEEIRIVGGAIRNALLGRHAHEIDLATTALPSVVIERANAAHIRSIPTGISHGTITLLSEGETFEVTTLREDVATDGRHAEVSFGRSFEADAMRRDFRINAFFMDRDGVIYDYVSGMEDLTAQRIRFIGDPMQRIAEDYLRILRFFRFSAEYSEGSLDPDGLYASLKQRDGLRRLSPERVHAELFKLFCARRAGDVVREMSETGLLSQLLGVCPFPARLERFLGIEKMGKCDPLLRLAALCLGLPEIALKLRERLRLSNEEFNRLNNAGKLLPKLHDLDEPPDERSLKAFLFQYGRSASVDALTLAELDARPGQNALWEKAIDYLRRTPVPKLPFSGKDLLALGFENGPAIGEVLKKLSARWMYAGFPNDEVRLKGILEDVLKLR